MYRTHEQVLSSGAVIEQLEYEIAHGATRVPAVRLAELKTASGLNRISVMFKELPWLSGEVAHFVLVLLNPLISLLLYLQLSPPLSLGTCTHSRLVWLSCLSTSM